MTENKKLDKVVPQGREVPGSISKTWFVANKTVSSDLITCKGTNDTMCSVKHQLRHQQENATSVEKAAFGLSSAWMEPVHGGHLPLLQGRSTNKAISLAMHHLSFFKGEKT